MPIYTPFGTIDTERPWNPDKVERGSEDERRLWWGDTYNNKGTTDEEREAYDAYLNEQTTRPGLGKFPWMNPLSTKDYDSFVRDGLLDTYKKKRQLDAEGERVAVAPDLTDKLLRDVRVNTARRLSGKFGRQASFLTGPLGPPQAPTISKSLLGGGQ